MLFLSIDSAEEFVGTERFTIERRLGAGGFGVVYRALDRKRGAPVALKALRRTESDALYRFKQEFRSLADIAHPNLVTLYELLCEADRWFFTMELVEGVNFLEYVHAGLRPEGEDPERGASPTASFGAVEGVQGLMSAADSASADDRLRLGQGSPALGRVLTEPETQRLRPALRQLAEGLHALHRAGKLHRDIKPSNVLVTPEGRVVLLDFGLVSDLGPEGFLHSVHLVGTPAYMSPEQAAGRPVTEASDWYGVGVMLYEALTGMRPFPGEFLDVLVEKQQSEPPPPRSVVPGVPEDLDALCRELLQRDPARRPSAREILRRLEPQAGKAVEAPPPISHRAAPFVGRGSHLAELAEAFDRTRQGRAVAVLVRGSSGVGKTALVRRFLEQVRRREPDAIVLSGRSYEQETVPYKALDSLLDALSQYLKRVDPGEAEALLPRDLLALVRLFPVLRQVEAVAHARRRVVAIPDSLELRRRGFRALRELCARLADRRSLVLFVDDLQWGDADSAALLADLLRPPEPPPLLFIGCFRVEGGSENLLLRALLALRTPETSELEVRELAVRDLPPDEAEELARELLEADEGHGSASAAAIARESRGNPFFIDELARHLRAGAAIATGAVSLDDVIWERAAGLPEEARRLLEAVAVAGRPLDRSTARRAAALSDDDQPALAVLRVGHLLRGSDAAPEERIEIYHDRIRQTIVSRLSTEACELVHRRLAFALETSGMPDPESLAIHYQGAGLKERAALYAMDAAEKAAETLAFDRAARLYRLALELGTTNAAAGQRIKVLLGAALANAGRGAEAGEAYLAAAQGASSGEMLELQRLAAEQLLRSGHVDQGLSVLRAVLKRIAMRFPATPRRALLSFLFRRILLHGRGLGFRERPATEIPSETLIRIDTCWSVSAGLSLIDTIRGRDFQARHLLLALRAGEPYRVARAMGPEAGYTAYLAGWKGRHRTARIVEQAMTLAGRVDQPHALGMAYLGAALAAFLEGRWRVGLELAHQCEDILRDLCTGVAWELDMVHVFSLRILVILGKLRELSERLPRLLKEARERGDLFAETSLRTRLSYVLLLMADAPEQAREELAAAAAQWSQQAFYMQHYFRLFGDVETDLYAGAGRLARERLEKGWWGLEESLMRRAELFRIESQHLRARCAVSAAAEAARAGTSPRQLLHLAIRDARRIEREATPWADPLAALVRAGAESVEGQRQKALASLEQAASGLDAADMALYAGAARLCRGRLLGGEAGARLIAEAEAGMRAERVRNPERMTAMLAPGLWSP